MKLTGAINLRIDQSEIERAEILREKGIRHTDIYRRGLEAYEKDIEKAQEVS